MMTGKEVSVSPFVSSYYEGMSSSAVNNDLEEMFQLIYLNFTALNKDKEAYQSYVDKQSAFLGNVMNTPQYWYMNEKAKVMEKNNPRFTNAIPTPEEFTTQNYDLAYRLYTERFKDASDFTFMFVGSFEEAKLLEYANKYLASLPSKNKKEMWVDHPFENLKGQQEFVFNRGEDPKSSVEITYRTEAKYNSKDAYYLQCAGEALTIKLVENLREGESGVYGVGARGSASQWPKGVYNFSISFPCGPENVEKLKAAALAEVDNLLKNGPSEKDLAKVKEAQKLELKENMKKNRFWISTLYGMYYNQEDFNDILKMDAEIDALTAENIKTAANKYIASDRVIMVLMPEK
jgi:zinc protease